MDDILITAGPYTFTARFERAAARVEIFRRGLCLDDRDGVGNKMGVEPFGEAPGRPVADEIEMGDLSQRVHARVGASGSMRDDALAGNGEDRVLQDLLDRNAVFLALPAGERRSVIFEGELEAGHVD